MKLTNEDAIGWLNGIKADGFGDNGEEEKETAIDMAIKALREQRERGKWEYKQIGISTCAVLCSECGNILHKGENYTDVADYRRLIQQMLKNKGIDLDNFCPHCGADMREGDAE